ncbi:unnamed protein product [Allacma fusca]|uniref:XK-related protein n=1 Tax=Allacma fusca TaxID=39272 RepID=A0A8J2LI45_9HEXA|nr:unnamed protein product [Allacma fusca]
MALPSVGNIMEGKDSPGGIFNTVRFSEIFPMEEITHFQRINEKRAGPSSLITHDDRSDSFSDTNHLRHTQEWESDSDESNIEVFNRPENYDSDILDIEPGTSAVNSEDKSFKQDRGKKSPHDLPIVFPSFPEPFILDVKRADVILDAIVFLTIVGEVFTDFTLAIWHYRNGMKWASGITWMFILLGAGSILQQFNSLDEDQIKRLYNRGKRIRILVNCLPPLAPILSSFQCVKVGYRATKDSMLSCQYVEVENFAKNLSKTQSVFQAAPQATIQLLLFIHSLNEGSIGLFKGFISVTNIILSIMVMTNSSLPSKAEDFDQVKKIGHTPKQRLYIGIRMFSSFASRIMAVAALFSCLRCLFGPEYNFSAAVLSLSILVVPRVICSLVDFIRQIIIGRRARDPAGFPRIACFDVFLGYMATILFPVGDPIWIFWYIWAETVIFIMVNNVTGWSKRCLNGGLNATYTGGFLVLFIIIPIVVPYVRSTAKRRRARRMQRFFQDRHPVEPSETSGSEMPSS